MADVIELARRHDDAFNSHDADGRAAIEAPDIEVVMPGGIELRGHEQAMEAVRAFWEALPDGTITTNERLAAGDVVVTQGMLAGTHSGTFRTPQGEIPPTGRLFRGRPVRRQVCNATALVPVAAVQGGPLEPSGRNQWQPVAKGRPRRRLKQAETVAVGCDRLPIGAHRKEGADGSTPSEALTAARKTGVLSSLAPTLAAAGTKPVRAS